MRILYLWVDKYRDFINQEFNLSSEYTFKYDKNTRCLTESKNDSYIKNFFSLDNKSKTNIEEITVIVGNNGVGKTTLLDLILEISELSSKRIIGFNYILAYKYDDNIKYMSSHGFFIKKDLKKYYYINSNKNILKDILLIYYTNTFDNKVRYLNNKNIYDISTMNLIKEDNKNVNYKKNYYNDNCNTKKEIFDFNKIFFEQEIERQIEFMSKFNESDKCLIGFKLKSKIKIEFVDLKNILTEILDRLDYYNDYPEYISKIHRNNITGEEILQSINKAISNIYYMYSEVNINQKKKFKLNLYLGFLLNLLGLIIQNPSKNFLEESTIIKFIGRLYDELEDYNIQKINEVTEYIDILDRLIINLYFIYEEFDNKEFYLLNQFLDLVENLSSYDIEPNDKGSYYISIYKFGEFNNLYKSIMIKYEIINFSWGLSSGEYNLLSFYARLYYISEKYIKKNNSNSKDLTILIDEADLSFHPEWQRRYIKSIIGFFNTIFDQYKIHVILTTHSPILLSDIPNENVLYLSRDKNKTICTRQDKKTFGANIYNLYKDNFYFDSNDAINSIGEFAEYKIDEIKELMTSVKKLIDDNGDKNEIKRILDLIYKMINKIGEDLIRDSLLDQYYNLIRFIDDSKAEKVKNIFNSLDKVDKKLLIKYIINQYKGRGI